MRMHARARVSVVRSKKSRSSISSFSFQADSSPGIEFRIGRLKRHPIPVESVRSVAGSRYSCARVARYSFRRHYSPTTGETGVSFSSFLSLPRSLARNPLSEPKICHFRLALWHTRSARKSFRGSRPWPDPRASCRAAIEPLSYFANVVLLTT